MRTPIRILVLAALAGLISSIAAASASADVSAIAFSRSASNEGGVHTAAGVWAMPASGGQATMLAEGGAGMLSPDGRRLAYAGELGKDFGIVVSEVDGSKPVMALGGNPSFYGRIGFSSRGEIAVAPFFGDEYRGFDLTVAGADGSNRRVVYTAPDPYEVTSPSFGPGGDVIVFYLVGDGPYTGGIWSVGIDGSNPHMLLDDGAAPVLSPDGTKLAFFDCFKIPSSSRSQCDVLLANADGSAAINLTNTPNLDETYPVFSPDGSKLAFETGEQYVKDENGNPTTIPSSIETMNLDGSNRVNLTGALPGEEYGPSWADVAALPPPPPDPCKVAKKAVKKAQKRFKKLREKRAPAKKIAKAKEKIKETKVEAKDACR